MSKAAAASAKISGENGINENAAQPVTESWRIEKISCGITASAGIANAPRGSRA
jgi:hypothetical protein